MQTWLLELDRVLRGDATRPADLHDGVVPVSARRLAVTAGLLGAFYGLCLGFFGLFNHDSPEYRLLANGALKVPALFALTLAVTFPSLYVFTALSGSRLTPVAVARLLAAAMAVTLAVLASFGPIVAFFAVTTTSYPFILLLNVAVFSLAGLLGVGFLVQTLRRLVASLRPPAAMPAAPAAEDVVTVVPAREDDRRVMTVFAVWAVVFGLVGAQMSWVLRPFVGNPDQPFTWFRPREASFFEAVLNALRGLLT
jgi:hypothetical protein